MICIYVENKAGEQFIIKVQDNGDLDVVLDQIKAVSLTIIRPEHYRDQKEMTIDLMNDNGSEKIGEIICKDLGLKRKAQFNLSMFTSKEGT
jgi:hypothetical protein